MLLTRRSVIGSFHFEHIHSQPMNYCAQNFTTQIPLARKVILLLEEHEFEICAMINRGDNK
jgi:hypothetical protein